MLAASAALMMRVLFFLMTMSFLSGGAPIRLHFEPRVPSASF